MSEETKSFPARVWETLKAVDVSNFTETKDAAGGRKVSYLSWAVAWDMLMEVYPESCFEFGELETHGEADSATVMVWCGVTISEGEDHMKREAWLPVMTGYTNAAEACPDARGISDARMRCLVKALAFCGLGLSVYRGEDVPDFGQEAPITVTEVRAIEAMIVQLDGDEAKTGKTMEGMVDYVNKRRAKEGADDPAISKVADMTGVEAKVVMKILGVKIKKKEERSDADNAVVIPVGKDLKQGEL